MASRDSAVVRVGIPTLAVAIIATGVMIAVNYATSDETTGPWAWMIVGVATLASAVASLWLFRRAQGETPGDDATAASPGKGSLTTISRNTFNGPTGMQGNGVQNNRFGT